MVRLKRSRFTHSAIQIWGSVVGFCPDRHVRCDVEQPTDLFMWLVFFVFDVRAVNPDWVTAVPCVI